MKVCTQSPGYSVDWKEESLIVAAPRFIDLETPSTPIEVDEALLSSLQAATPPFRSPLRSPLTVLPITVRCYLLYLLLSSDSATPIENQNVAGSV